MTTENIDEKGRRRRGRVTNPDVESPAQVEEAEEVAVELPAEPEKPKRTRTRKPAATKEPAKTPAKGRSGPKAGAKTGAKTGTTTNKEEPTVPPGAGRPTKGTYEDVEVEGTVSDEDLPKTTTSVFAGVIDTIIANNKTDKEAWTIIHPRGRKPSSVQSALQSAADKREAKIETRSGGEGDSLRVYARISTKKAK